MGRQARATEASRIEDAAQAAQTSFSALVHRLIENHHMTKVDLINHLNWTPRRLEMVLGQSQRLEDVAAVLAVFHIDLAAFFQGSAMERMEHE